MLRLLAEEIHRNAVDHGWWDDNRSFAEVIALCHSELSEALEEAREGNINMWHSLEGGKRAKPEGAAVEMIDCIIRILDWFGHEGIDPDQVILEKMRYNEGRPYKHGKLF